MNDILEKHLKLGQVFDAAGLDANHPAMLDWASVGMGIKTLLSERDALQARLADREDLLRHIRSKRTVHPCPGCCDTDRLIDTALKGE